MMNAPQHHAITLQELLTGFVSVAPSVNVVIHGLCLDSRSLRAGDLFFALSGSQTDGRQFINEVVQQGAVAVLYDETAGRIDFAGTDIPLIAVSKLSEKLGAIAARYNGDPSRTLKVIGITGTNGKTSVSHFVAQALANDKDLGPCGLIGTVGYGFPDELLKATHTTPDPVSLQSLMLDMSDQGASSIAMEVSSHGLVQGRVSGTHFNTAVFTNLSRDHLDYHRDMAQYAAAKALLFNQTGLKTAVINIDDDYGRRLASALRIGVQCIGFSLSSGPFDESLSNQMIRGQILEHSRDGLRLSVFIDSTEYSLDVPIIGRFNASNLLAAIGCLLSLGMDAQTAVKQVSMVVGVAGRMQCFGRQDQPLVVVDFAHTPDALRQALKTLRELKPKRLVCVFGCGGDRDVGKRAQMGRVAAERSDHVILSNDNPRSESPDAILRDIRQGIPASFSVEEIPDRAEAIAAAITAAGKDDIVLVAGKGHEEFQLIDNQRIPFSDCERVSFLLKEDEQ